jgi:hypothetical protein
MRLVGLFDMRAGADALHRASAKSGGVSGLPKSFKQRNLSLVTDVIRCMPDIFRLSRQWNLLMEEIANFGSQATSRLPDTALRRIVLSSIIGTAVEWYDFAIFATATALVFNKLFFPTGVASLSTIVAFATYGVGFFARPVGAAIFGHYGDKIGRKAMLAATIITMGVGTFLIGLLPT